MMMHSSDEPHSKWRGFSVVLIAGLIISCQKPLEDYSARIDLVPSFRLRGDSENIPTGSWGVIGTGSQFAVVIRRRTQIKFYDQDGNRIGEYGALGASPGMFGDLDPFRTGWLGDALWVYDQMFHRVTVLSVRGELLRVIPMPDTITAVSTRGRSQTVGLVSPRSLYPGDLMLAIIRRKLVKPGTNNREELALVSSDGTIRKAITTLDLREGSITRTLPGGGMISVSIPFYPRTRLAASPKGGYFAILTHSAFSGTIISNIVMYRSDGGILYDQELTLGKSRVTAAAKRAAMERLSAIARSETGRELLEEVRKRLPRVADPVTGLLVGEGGHAFLQLRSTDSVNAYLVLDPGGHELGLLRLNGDTLLTSANATSLLVVEYAGRNMSDVVGLSYGTSRK